MNLQEIAFMVSLINANYRRRMLYFWGNVLVIIAAFVAMHYSNVFLGFFTLLTLLLAALLRAFNVYVLKGDDELRLPWTIKKAQMTALRERAEAKGDFEDLQCHVPLHEYFEMY